MNLIWALSRYVLPILAVVIIVKCIMTLMLGHPKQKIYAYIVDMTVGTKYDLNMWETSVGRSNSCDVVLPYDSVARSHAVITRRIDGWYLHDLFTRAKLTVNGEKVTDKTTIKDGDIIMFGDQRFRFEISDDPVVPVGKKRKHGTQSVPERERPEPVDTYFYDDSLRRRTKVNEDLKKAYEAPANTGNYTYRPKRSAPTVKRSEPKIINRDTGESFILCGNEVSVGSSRKSDIKLKGASVERLHALLVLYEDGWAIDGVKGKTLLNGTLVKSAQLLFDGDVIAIGDERLYFSA